MSNPPKVSPARTFLTVVCVWAVAACALAQPRASGDDPRVERGVELRRHGDDEGALRLFTDAWNDTHAPRARAQMALAEQALGRFVDAEAHLEEALRARDDAWIARRGPDLEEALASIRRRLGSLDVRGGVPGAEVRVDGEVRGQLPLAAPIRLPAGHYHLEVVADGYYPASRMIEIEPGSTARETLRMARREDAQASGAAVAESEAPSSGDAAASEARARRRAEAGAGETRAERPAGSRGNRAQAAPPEAVALAPATTLPGPRVEASDAPVEPAPDRSVERARGLGRAGWALVAAGGAFGLIALTSYGIRERRAREYDSDSCLAGGRTRRENCGAVHAEAVRAQRLSAFSLGAATALALSGAGVLHRARRVRDQEHALALGCGVEVGGRWGGRCALRF